MIVKQLNNGRVEAKTDYDTVDCMTGSYDTKTPNYSDAMIEQQWKNNLTQQWRLLSLSLSVRAPFPQSQGIAADITSNNYILYNIDTDYKPNNLIYLKRVGNGCAYSTGAKCTRIENQLYIRVFHVSTTLHEATRFRARWFEFARWLSNPFGIALHSLVQQLKPNLRHYSSIISTQKDQKALNRAILKMQIEDMQFNGP